MNKPTQKNSSGTGQYFLGILVGGLLTFVVLFVLQQSVIEDWRTHVFWLSAAIFVVAIFFGLVVLFRTKILRLIFRRGHASLETISDETWSAAESVLDGEPRLALVHVRNAIDSILASYAWVALRSWIVSVFVALSAIYVGGVGTILLLEQNKRIEAQNEIIDKQREFAELEFILREGDRQASLNPLLFSALAKIDEFVPDGEGAKQKGAYEGLYEPHATIVDVNRIAATLSVLQPYWRFDSYYELELTNGGNPEVGVPNTRPIPDSNSRLVFASPERGLILQAMIAKAIHMGETTFKAGYGAKIQSNSLFAFADARNLEILPVAGKGALNDFPILEELLDIQLCGTENESGVNPQDRELQDFFVRIDPAFLPNVLFSGASFQNVMFEDMKGLDLKGARLYESAVTIDSDEDILALEQLMSTQGVEFQSSFKLLPQLAPYLSEEFNTIVNGEQGEINLAPHKANCLMLDLNLLSDKEFAEFGTKDPLKWIEMTYNALASALGWTDKAVRESFRVQVEEDVSRYSTIFVRRQIFTYG